MTSRRIIAPIALGFAFRYQISPLLMGLMVVHGAQAGAEEERGDGHPHQQRLWIGHDHEEASAPGCEVGQGPRFGAQGSFGATQHGAQPAKSHIAEIGAADEAKRECSRRE